MNASFHSLVKTLVMTPLSKFLSRIVQVGALLLLSAACPGGLRAAGVDLAVNITGPSGRVSLNSNLVYSVTVTNLGDAPATEVKVTNQIAVELNFISVTSSQGSCSSSSGEVSCHLGALAAGAHVTITIRTQPVYPQGDYYAFATVEAAQEDLNLENNFAVVTSQVGITDLALQLTASETSVVAGTVVTYVLTVTNKGIDRCDASIVFAMSEVNASGNEMVSMTPSKGSTWLSESSEGGWADFGLQPGESATLTLAIRLLLARGPSEPFGISSIAYVSPNGSADPHLEDNLASITTIVSSGPGVIRFESESIGVDENRGEAILVVQRNGGGTGAVSIQYATRDGTAVAGSDYVATNGLLVFQPGETSRQIRVPLLPVAETKCEREFSVRLHSPAGGAFLRAPTNAVVAIVEDYMDIVPRGVTECINVTHDDPQRAAKSSYQDPYTASISADGRYALFSSDSGEIVPNDHNGEPDVFLCDLTTGITTLVSVNRAGTDAGNVGSYDPRMSGDGRYVVFQSSATDLTTNVVTGVPGIYLRDMVAGTTRLLSVNTNGMGANFDSYYPLISSNGLAAAFLSNATDLHPAHHECNCESPLPNIYAVDLASGAIQLVTKNLSGVGMQNPNGVSLAGLSADGRFVVFATDSGELVTGDENSQQDVFIADLTTGEVRLVSANHAGTGSGNGHSYESFMQISADGRHVLFTSVASDLVPEDDDSDQDVFLRDMTTGITKLVSVNWTGTNGGDGTSLVGTMTPDGRHVAFLSRATDLLPGYTPPPPNVPVDARQNVFLRDMLTGVTTLVSAACDGRPMVWGDAYDAVITADGNRIFFTAYGGNLVPGNPGGVNLYMRNLAAGATTLVSANVDYTGGAQDSGYARPSADGRSVMFGSALTDLTSVINTHQTPDLYVWRELPDGIHAQLNMKVGTVSKGQVMHTFLAVTNLGPDTAHNVMVTNTLTPGLRFVELSTTGGSCSVEGTQIVCTLGTLARRGGAVISILATAVADGPASYTAIATSSDPDPIPLDNKWSNSGQFMLPAPGALSIIRVREMNYVSWLAAPDDFQLQWKPFLEPSPVWSQHAGPILNNGTLKTAPVSSGSVTPSGFYRLRR